MESEEPKSRGERRFLKKRRWRFVVLLLVIALASLAFQFVIEAPIHIPDSFLALPFLSLWQPLFGLPLIAFSVWWVLDKRVSLFVLIIPFVLIAYCGRLLVGSPPERTDEEHEAFMEFLTEEERERFSERRNRPRYKRNFFPPFEK
ncbi:MAG: hypothetical protein P1U85_19645 [Verrucomicrobiales bacterium]|nr:hypothetical protein [Verrucomicrobiales bacterium]